MSSAISYVVAHKVELASILFAISELLGFAGKGGVFKSVYDVLKSLAGK